MSNESPTRANADLSTERSCLPWKQESGSLLFTTCRALQPSDRESNPIILWRWGYKSTHNRDGAKETRAQATKKWGAQHIARSNNDAHPALKSIRSAHLVVELQEMRYNV